MFRWFIFCVLLFNSKPTVQAQHRLGADTLYYPELVSAFYTLINQQSFWLNNTQSSLRKDFTNVIDSASNWALNANDYHDRELRQLAETFFTEKDSVAAKHCELLFTDAAISFFKDLYEGSNNNAGYDELSPKYTEIDNRILLNILVALCNRNCLEDVICSLEPANNEYIILKKEYQKQIVEHSSSNLVQLQRALNYLRWINHFKFLKYIVVNIPFASLNYYQADTIALTMKVVAGKPSTQTP